MINIQLSFNTSCFAFQYIKRVNEQEIEIVRQNDREPERVRLKGWDQEKESYRNVRVGLRKEWMREREKGCANERVRAIESEIVCCSECEWKRNGEWERAWERENESQGEGEKERIREGVSLMTKTPDSCGSLFKDFLERFSLSSITACVWAGCWLEPDDGWESVCVGWVGGWVRELKLTRPLWNIWPH